MDGKLHDYTGVIHLHSSFSFDGHAPMEQILAAAEKNGIDFIMLTDHDHLKARFEGWEGWQNKTLVIVGQEIAPRFNHYLAFNIREPVLCAGDPAGKSPQRYIDEVNRQGGFGFIAHPDHEGTQLFHVKHYSWNNWDVRDFAGIGVWDFMTDWQQSLRGYGSALLSFLFPAFVLQGPRGITLERWDALNQIRKTVGIGELDNHATVKKLLGIRFVAFPFQRAFAFIRTHVLTETDFTGNNQKDIATVCEALLQGRCYFALEYFRRSKGFHFTLEQDQKIYQMGECTWLASDARLSISCPAKALIRVIRNGREEFGAIGDRLSLKIDKTGVYRVEAHLRAAGKTRPWIFSNPIFVN
ncbi:MAG TPA: CehA/McbA family metallohydrolase [Smithellaceae bacterium]|nr:CehA/McbA family metallohydrolase [Smithellaceae bacterium]HRV44900.1 CehA/McbA family metallohydrolase [Smithellaceae bacterium]